MVQYLYALTFWGLVETWEDEASMCRKTEAGVKSLQIFEVLVLLDLEASRRRDVCTEEDRELWCAEGSIKD